MLLVLPGIAAADIVTDWSLITTQAVVTKGGRAGAWTSPSCTPPCSTR